MIQIKSIFTGHVLKEVDADTLKDAHLRGAYLWDADLRGADLRGADLGGANLRGANLRGAKINSSTKWPSPTMVLLAWWGEVKPSLCLDLMRYDASNHPNPKSFFAWSKTGVCPYEGLNIERSAIFQQRAKLIKKDFLQRKTKSAYQLINLLLKEYCKVSK